MTMLLLLAITVVTCASAALNCYMFQRVEDTEAELRYAQECKEYWENAFHDVAQAKLSANVVHVPFPKLAPQFEREGTPNEDD